VVEEARLEQPEAGLTPVNDGCEWDVSPANQEDFLVLADDCLLLMEGEERPLKAWDFVRRLAAAPCPAHARSRSRAAAGSGELGLLRPTDARCGRLSG
jgi:hypothetical protein